MTTVLDATPLIEVFTLGQHEPEVAALLERDDCVVSSVNLAEIAYTIAGEEDLSVGDVRRFVEPRIAGLMEVVDATAEHAWRAADLRNRHYHRRSCRISLADCFLLATARPGDTVLTADRAVVEVAREEGIDARLLGGRRP